jgi:hypothetical protein
VKAAISTGVKRVLPSRCDSRAVHDTASLINSSKSRRNSFSPAFGYVLSDSSASQATPHSHSCTASVQMDTLNGLYTHLYGYIMYL